VLNLYISVEKISIVADTEAGTDRHKHGEGLYEQTDKHTDRRDRPSEAT